MKIFCGEIQLQRDEQPLRIAQRDMSIPLKIHMLIQKIAAIAGRAGAFIHNGKGCKMTLHDCDLCRSAESIELDFLAPYTDGTPIHVCKGCGFVFVRQRRSAQEIANAWDPLYEEGYDPSIPAVLGRLTYVAHWAAQHIGGWEGKSVLDIGAGKGQFLEIARGLGAYVVGLDPSLVNCRLLRSKDIAAFHGYIDADGLHGQSPGNYDVITILWTLENTQDCMAVLRWAREHLNPGGHLVVATGSRILVPFKKPIDLYLSKNPGDTHCFRWSRRSLFSAVGRAGFCNAIPNRYIDHDVLAVVAEKENRSEIREEFIDDPAVVVEFFRKWVEHTNWLKSHGIA